MEHQRLLMLLYPRLHPYTLLTLEIIPTLVAIGLRFQMSDIKDRKALAFLSHDSELKNNDYYRFKMGLVKNKLFVTDTLLTLLGYRKEINEKGKSAFVREFKTFISEERKAIKNNLSAHFYKGNVMSIGRLSFTLCLGALFIKYAYRDVEAYRDAYMRELALLEMRYDPVQFMKYLLNGARAEFWPYDTSFRQERFAL